MDSALHLVNQSKHIILLDWLIEKVLRLKS